MASTSVEAVGKASAPGSVTSSCNQTQRGKSCDTLCSSTSSYLLKKKPNNTLAGAIRAYGAKPTSNTVKQRVLSAKLLKLRNIQSQLNDANLHLVELAKENQALKTLQRRQDKALSSYEGAHADLPRLIKSHEEEIRVLQDRNKTLRKTQKDLGEQLKLKEEELASAKEQLKHLTSLAKDKHLAEREKLAEQVEDLKAQLSKSDAEISTLNRKLMLETKNYKFKLNNESTRYRQSQRDLAAALAEIDRLTALLESKGKYVAPNCRKITPSFQSVSMVNFDRKKPELLNGLESPNDLNKTDPNPTLTSPLENIKARLSASSRKYKSELDDLKKIGSETDLHARPDFLYTSDSKTDLHSKTEIPKSIYSQNMRRSRPTSSQRLEKLEESLKQMNDDDSGGLMNEYCSTIVNSVKSCKTLVDRHKESFETAKEATENILTKLKVTDKLSEKLRKNKQISKDELEFPEKNVRKLHYSLNKSSSKSSTETRIEEKSLDRNANVTRDPSSDESDMDKFFGKLPLKDMCSGDMNHKNEKSVVDVSKIVSSSRVSLKDLDLKRSVKKGALKSSGDSKSGDDLRSSLSGEDQGSEDDRISSNKRDQSTSKNKKTLKFEAVDRNDKSRGDHGSGEDLSSDEDAQVKKSIIKARKKLQINEKVEYKPTRARAKRGISEVSETKIEAKVEAAKWDFDSFKNELPLDASDKIDQPNGKMDFFNIRRKAIEAEVKDSVKKIQSEVHLAERPIQKNEKITIDVSAEEKRKLLETLRAIDNGENIDEITYPSYGNRGKVMNELFGDLHD